MPEGSSSSTIAVWIDPAQSALIREVTDAARARIVAAGTFARGQAGAVAAGFNAASADDLRSLVSTSTADALLIAAAGDFGSRAEDLRALASARTRGTKIFVLDPIPQSIFDLTHLWRTESSPSGDDAPSSDRQTVLAGLDRSVRLLGLPTRSRSFIDAAEPLAAFGKPRTASVRCTAPMGLVSLGSRLVAAFDLLLAIFPGFEHPSWIDASRSVPGSTSAAARASTLPESLRGVDGDVVALVRFADARASTIHASDRAGNYEFDLHLLSSQGEFRINDRGFVWNAPDGTLRASHDAGKLSMAELLGAELRSCLQLETSTPAIIDRALASAQTALLSAKTGQPESPATVLEMARRLDS